MDVRAPSINGSHQFENGYMLMGTHSHRHAFSNKAHKDHKEHNMSEELPEPVRRRGLENGRVSPLMRGSIVP